MESKSALTQEQQLRLKLNPQQVRFGRLLEMSVPEFDEEIARVVDENPALEVSPDTAATDRDEEGTPFTETSDELMRADYRTEDDVPSYRTRDRWSYTAEFAPHEQADESAGDLEALTEQLSVLTLSERQREIATYIIGNLDENGYLLRSTSLLADDLSVATGDDVSTAEMDAALRIVQALDPPGIGARDLRECLLLQLDRMEPSATVDTARNILRNHYNAFVKKHYDFIRNRTNAKIDDIKAAIALLLRLNPKPGSLLTPAGVEERMRYITPDFIVETDPEGAVSVSLNGPVPRLELEHSFRLTDAPAAPAGSRRAAADAFIRARRDEAVEFMDMVRRRGETLLTVMEAIVRLQPDFFTTFDRSRLRPMVLRDIRDLTGLDLSVISRATAGKYVLTERGVFPLKMFFSEAVGDAGISVPQLEEELRRLIEHEDPATPLSDEELAAELNQCGLPVARRTVAKYRERMGFPVARLRVRHD